VDDREVTKRVFPRRMVPLTSLEPQWLATDARRHQMGISILCPAHPFQAHRAEFWFLNPADTDPPKPAQSLFYRTGATLGDLTLSLAQHGPQILVTPHWSGYIHDGWVIDSLGVAW
jgi:hypothetical protein